MNMNIENQRNEPKRRGPKKNLKVKGNAPEKVIEISCVYVIMKWLM